jgi:hypothetical protein
MVDDNNVRLSSRNGLSDLAGFVSAPVVNHDNFPPIFGLQAIEIPANN